MIKIWRKLPLYLRKLRFGDFSTTAYFDIESPEVIKSKLFISRIDFITGYLKHTLSSVLKAHSHFLLENRLLKHDKQPGSSSINLNHHKSCINNQWKNAFCLLNNKNGLLHLQADKNSSGIYFYIGRQILSKPEGTLKIYLTIGNHEKIILQKRLKAIHHNWDLFFYKFNEAEMERSARNKIKVRWTVDKLKSRLFISPPFLKGNHKDTHRIIVLVADSIRPQDLGIYNKTSNHTPNIDELASKGTIFTNSFSQSNWTLPTFASMAVSLYASQHRVVDPNKYLRVIDRSVPTIAELFKQNKFFTYGDVSHRRCNQSLGHHRGYDHFGYEQTSGEGNPMENQLKNACNTLKNIKGVSVFMFLHLFDTHAPYFFRNGSMITKNLLEQHPLKHYIGLSNKKELSLLENNYIKEAYFSTLARLDRELKELFKCIYEDENATLILMSDHGFSFEQFASANKLADSNIRTPFIVYSNQFPIKKGKCPSIVESSVDLLPTLTSLYKINDTFQRSGSRIFDDSFNVINKQYAISEIVYEEDYQLKIVDVENRYVIFRASRKRRSGEIDLENIIIEDCGGGGLSAIEFRGIFAGYVDSSKLGQQIKTALSKSLCHLKLK